MPSSFNSPSETPADTTKVIPKTGSRTSQIPVVDASEPEMNSESHYQLQIEAGDAPNEVFTKKNQKKHHSPEVTSGKFRIPGLSYFSGKNHQQGKVKNRLWNLLEWLVTSALIFMAIFFFINYQAYSQLFISKIDQIWGNAANSAEVNQNSNANSPGHAASPAQQPLPLNPVPDESKKQVPYLNLQVTPPDDRIVLPRIKKNVPIVQVSEENLISRNWGALEKDIQSALQDGVVHYPGSAYPGSHGNVVITGHSSYFAWDPGRFKDVFALLTQLNIGDTVVVYYNQQKYTYQIYDEKVVMPNEVDVLSREAGDRLTLITCTPIGTNLKRLIVLAKPV